MIPLFLSDLDGTLIHEESAMISSDDVQEIKNWQKQGYLFGLVTGRDRVFCMNLLNRYEIVPDCLITCNGAMTFWKDHRIDASLIDLSVAKNILKELETYLDTIDPFLQQRMVQIIFFERMIQNAYRKNLLILGGFEKNL